MNACSYFSKGKSLLLTVNRQHEHIRVRLSFLDLFLNVFFAVSTVDDYVVAILRSCHDTSCNTEQTILFITKICIAPL